MLMYKPAATSTRHLHRRLAPTCRTHLPAVHRSVHNVQPSLEDGHLQEAEVGLAHMIESHRRRRPNGLACSFLLRKARGLVRDDAGVEGGAVWVGALHTEV